MIALGIVIAFAMLVYFFTVRIAPGLFAGMMTATIVIAQTDLVSDFRAGFDTEEMRGYVSIALFFGIALAVAFIMQQYNSGRRFHGSIGRIVFSVVFGAVYGLLAVVLLRSVIGVKELLTVPNQFSTLIAHPYALLGLCVASLLALYVGKGR